MDHNNLPNFLILGAAKSGTTSLYQAIASHPDVYGSPRKQTAFFSNDRYYVRGLDWYESRYFRDAGRYPVRSEATAVYLTWSEKTAPRIRDALGRNEIKFACIFRDPVERAYSHYWHKIRSGEESLAFAQAIREEPRRLERYWNELRKEGDGRFGYLRASCYAARLAPFLELFPRQSFFLLLLEDLIRDFTGSLRALQAFLNLQPLEAQPVLRNSAEMPRSRVVFQIYRLLKETFLQHAYRSLLPATVRAKFHSAIAPSFRYPPIDPELDAILRTELLPEIQGLEAILRRDLSHWYPETKNASS